jgi:hypothetical protein
MRSGVAFDSAVTVAHLRPYLFMTDAAATGLGLQEIGLAHGEVYPDAGQSRVASSSSAARRPSLATLRGRRAGHDGW